MRIAPAPGKAASLSVRRSESKRRPSSYPFAAIVGMEAAKRAMLLLAVDRGLRGALIRPGKGSTAITLARSFAAMLARLDWPGTAPEDGASRAKGRAKAAFPFIDIPLNVTADRLLGGVDLERTVVTGAIHSAPGLLSEANGGLLFVADINLLDANLADHIAAALDEGVVRVEREGVSAAYPARFRFVGSYNPAEGEVGPHLKDRIGIIVEIQQEQSAEEIAEAVSRALRFEQDPRGFVEEFAFESAALESAIVDARRRLDEISVTSRDIRRIAEAAISLGVEGNRADMLAVRAARANAALTERDFISDQDLITAIQLVLLPRATKIPAPEENKAEASEPAASACKERSHDNRVEQDGASADGSAERASRPIEELVVEAMDAPAPDDALSLPRSKAARGATGRRSRVLDRARGRYAGSDSRRANNRRVAIDATLCAAAPHQAARRDKRSALPARDAEGTKIHLAPGDLRFKRFKRKAGILFIFAVDASGSMALNRMAQAKGALARLLQQAYLHRDKVALISFRRSTAETVLAPTRSVELAKRIVDAMPTGGATPVAAALIEALRLARLARSQGISQSILLLLTDGRANVGLHAGSRTDHSQNRETISEELERIGSALAIEGVAAAVIDTRPRFVSTGEGRALAELIGGRYLYLPRADSIAIYKAVASISAETRRQS